MTEQLNKKAQDILAKMQNCVPPNCAEEFSNLLADFIRAYKARQINELELPEKGTVYHNDDGFYYVVSEVLHDNESCLVLLRTMPRLSKGVFREGLITMTLGEFEKMNLQRGY